MPHVGAWSSIEETLLLRKIYILHVIRPLSVPVLFCVSGKSDCQAGPVSLRYHMILGHSLMKLLIGVKLRENAEINFAPV